MNKKPDPQFCKEFGYLSIKERLLIRFTSAKNSIGKNWRGRLMEADPFFCTKAGCDCMTSVAQAVSAPGRGNVDRIERVVIVMERLVGEKINVT